MCSRVEKKLVEYSRVSPSSSQRVACLPYPLIQYTLNLKSKLELELELELELQSTSTSTSTSTRSSLCGISLCILFTPFFCIHTVHTYIHTCMDDCLIHLTD
jgi:hypothetical protein